MTIATTTPGGTTLELIEDVDEPYIIARQPANPEPYREVIIGYIQVPEGKGPGFNIGKGPAFTQYEHLNITYGPDVLRGVADIIDQINQEK